MIEKSANESQEPGAMTVDRFCEWSGCGRTYAFAEIKAGRLIARRHRSRILIRIEDAKAWLDALPLHPHSRRRGDALPPAD